MDKNIQDIGIEDREKRKRIIKRIYTRSRLLEEDLRGMSRNVKKIDSEELKEMVEEVWKKNKEIKRIILGMYKDNTNL